MNKYDVLVCGGGTAGMIAALASSRMGARTLLVEREGFIGGTATYGIPFLGFFSTNGQKVVGGIPQELVDRMVSVGGSVGHVRGGKWREKIDGQKAHEFSLTPFDPEYLKYVAQEMLLESGVNIMLQSTLTGVNVENKEISSIEVMTVEGHKKISADYFIDATGDAILTELAGFQTEKQGKGNMQNVTSIMRIGNVDSEQILDNLLSGRGIKGSEDWHIRIVRGKLLDGKEGIVHIAGHADVYENKAPQTFTAVAWRKGEISFNISKTINIDPTKAEDITEAEVSERRNVYRILDGFKKRVPGFSQAYLISSSHRVGIRESRRIKGLYTLTENDVVDGKDFSDGIARGAYPIDIHDPKGGKTQFSFIRNGGSYSIPYRCLIPDGSLNLLVAGRCISATGKALGSVRLMATCMAMGQAVGYASAIAASEENSVADISINKLRNTLIDNGAILTV